VILNKTFNPDQFYEAAEKHAPTLVVTSPGLASGVAEYGKGTLAGSARELCKSIEVLQVGGSALSPQMSAAFADNICPTVHVNYGTTETGKLARLDLADPNVPHGSGGRLFPWVQAEAVSDEDIVLPAGQIGELRFKSATISGIDYLGDPVFSAQVFRNGWYYPGDMGAVDAAGYIYLRGRKDSLINLAGVKVSPEAVEEVLNAAPGVVESAVMSMRSKNALKPVLVAAVHTSSPCNVEDLRARCEERLGKLKTPRRFVFVPAIPKNAAGKIQREEIGAVIRAALAASRTEAQSSNADGMGDA
jgi:acyl-coenzyme A synthetase/AMP-(fatty) acid ligase